MSQVPVDEKRVINALVVCWGLWHNKSFDQIIPAPSIVELIVRCRVGNVFFMKVYRDLRLGSSGKYANYTELDFKRFLQTEYRRPVQVSQENPALWLAEAQEDYNRRTRAESDWLEVEPTWAQSVQLGPKRKKYENVCWRCHSHISSDELKRCSDCGWYICGNCGSCKQDCTRIYTPFVHNGADDVFLPDFPDE